jgi:hypothetical protein
MKFISIPEEGEDPRTEAVTEEVRRRLRLITFFRYGVVMVRDSYNVRAYDSDVVKSS